MPGAAPVGTSPRAADNIGATRAIVSKLLLPAQRGATKSSSVGHRCYGSQIRVHLEPVAKRVRFLHGGHAIREHAAHEAKQLRNAPIEPPLRVEPRDRLPVGHDHEEEPAQGG